MRSLALLLAVLFFAASAGCNREGPAEKAGRNIDKAAKDIRDAARDATK